MQSTRDEIYTSTTIAATDILTISISTSQSASDKKESVSLAVRKIN
jgi:hypothetical protein